MNHNDGKTFITEQDVPVTFLRSGGVFIIIAFIREIVLILTSSLTLKGSKQEDIWQQKFYHQEPVTWNESILP